MAKTTGRSPAGTRRGETPGESKHSHVELGTTRSRWDPNAGTDFAITTVNVPDRLDAQEVRARASADSAPPSVRRFRRVDFGRALGWLLALAVLSAVVWGAVRVAGPLRTAISPRGVEGQISEALNVPVSVRATELRILPSPRLVVTDVLAHGGLRLPEITVNFNWRDAFRGLQTSAWVLGEARVAPADLTGDQALMLLNSVRRASRLSAAVSTIRGARMNTSGAPASDVASKLSTCRPQAFRATVTSSSSRLRWAGFRTWRARRMSRAPGPLSRA